MAKQTYTTGQVLTAAQMTTLQTNDFNQTVSAKVASYTLVAADAGTRITMNNASATTVTVNTALFAAGDTLEITNIGAGICTVTAGSATVSTSSTLALKQFDTGQLYFTSTGVAIFFMADAADVTASGKVLQVVFAQNSSDTTINSTTFVDSGLTATITPTSNTSKIAIFATNQGQLQRTADTPFIGMRLMRDSTAIMASNIDGFSNTSGTEMKVSLVQNFVDSPATTSAITYKTQGAGTNVLVRLRFGFDGSTDTIILMEIGA